MKRLVPLAILALLGYLAYQRLPSSGGAGSGGDAPSHCAQLADAASDAFGNDVGRLYVPGGDREAWADFVTAVDGRIADARSQCSCPEPACGKATEALEALSDLVSRLDADFTSGSAPRNPARQLERIHGLLDQARSLAREGR